MTDPTPMHAVSGGRIAAPGSASVDAMLDDLARLVSAESFSSDREAVARCVEEVARLGERMLGAAPVRHPAAGREHLSWTFGVPRVLILCHLDTVWPIGTLESRPFRVTDGIATGPGVFDMKAGLVQALHALAALPSRDGVRLLVTSDEEIGSPSSREVIEALADGVSAVLVAEPSADGRLKTGRSGVSRYTLRVSGIAAHTGLDPDKGANALLELATQVHRIAALGDRAAGTTVTPTIARAGTAVNVVPDEATCEIDVRARLVSEQARVRAALLELRPERDGTGLEIVPGPERPPFEEGASAVLATRAEAVAARLGLPEPGRAVVGGGSDGNFTAALGIPTLDGLGPVGGGAHARDEHVVVARMPERVALLAALVADLIAEERDVERTDDGA